MRLLFCNFYYCLGPFTASISSSTIWQPTENNQWLQLNKSTFWTVSILRPCKIFGYISATLIKQESLCMHESRQKATFLARKWLLYLSFAKLTSAKSNISVRKYSQRVGAKIYRHELNISMSFTWSSSSWQRFSCGYSYSVSFPRFTNNWSCWLLQRQMCEDMQTFSSLLRAQDKTKQSNLCAKHMHTKQWAKWARSTTEWQWWCQMEMLQDVHQKIPTSQHRISWLPNWTINNSAVFLKTSSVLKVCRAKSNLNY